jgi:hypothetical protein
MPNQEDIIRGNQTAMDLRAQARRDGSVVGRTTPMTRAKAIGRIRIMQEEIDRLRAVPADVERLRSELQSIRAAHRAALDERDALERDLATLRAAIVPDDRNR